jgi:aminomethyltransferase
MLAVQGPRARDLLHGLSDGPLPPRMHFGGRTIAGVPMLVCGTGYTGEPGVELLLDPDGAGEVWDALVAAGATPAGLGARDTLRLEVGYHLYGNDLDRDHGPIEAGLGWCCREATGFVGSEAVARVRAEGPAEKLVAFEMTGPGIARQGNPVTGGGVVTSGTFSPCLERGIGMAYVPAERAEPGTELEIDVRGTPRAAVVRAKPLYTAKES